MFEYITVKSLISMLMNKKPLTINHLIAIDEYLSPFKLNRIGRTQAIRLLTRIEAISAIFEHNAMEAVA